MKPIHVCLSFSRHHKFLTVKISGSSAHKTRLTSCYHTVVISWQITSTNYCTAGFTR